MSRLKRIFECLNEQGPLGDGLSRATRAAGRIGLITPSDGPETLPLVDPPDDDPVWPFDLVDEDGNIVFPPSWDCQGDCADIYCPDAGGGCQVDPNTGDIYTIDSVSVNGTTYNILVVTHTDGSQYAYVGNNPAFPDGGWFLVVDGQATNISYNPINGQFIAFISGQWCYQGPGFNFPNGPWIGLDGNVYPGDNLENPGGWMFHWTGLFGTEFENKGRPAVYVETDIFKQTIEAGISIPFGDSAETEAWDAHLAAIDLLVHLFYLLYGELPDWAGDIEGYEPGDWYEPNEVEP